MGLQIEDGAGKGYSARVNDMNRLQTSAITETTDRHQNESGRMWTIYFEVTPVGANDYFFYIENTGSETLHITDIRISSSVATQMKYHFVSGTPSYTTTKTATTTTRNSNSSRVPTATIRDDTDITGLTSEGVIFFDQCAVADTMYHLKTTSNVRIEPGGKFAIEKVAATGDVICNVSLVEVFE